MKKWFASFTLLLVVLLMGYGSVYTSSSQFSEKKPQPAALREIKPDTGAYRAKRHSVETFKRKCCLLDNEENFSTIQKQLVKSSCFLHFLRRNKFAVCPAFNKKADNFKIFALLSNKVYLRFQVFRIWFFILSSHKLFPIYRFILCQQMISLSRQTDAEYFSLI